MKWSVGIKLGLGFGLALAVFVIVGVISFQTTQALIEAQGWRKHTYEVIGGLTDTLSALKDVETGHRGYLLTGDEKYLEPYQTGSDAADRSLQEVQKLTVDNSLQQSRLGVLRPVVRDHLAATKESIDAMGRGDREAALKFVSMGKGKVTMDEIRKMVADMQSEEERLLKIRSEDAENNATNVKRTIVVGSILALVIAGVAGFAITRNIAAPLQELTMAAQRIAVGDLSTNVVVDGRGDEVGLLAQTFHQMSQSLQKMAGTAEQMAAGNLRVTVQPQSPQDVFGNSFARMIETLQKMAGIAEQMAAGDLRATVQPQSPQDMLGTSFARMIENLREQTKGMVEGASVLGSAASEIVASTAQLASGATESATAVSETTTTVEEVRQTAQLASQKARAVSETAQKAAQVSQSGRKSAEDAMTGMGRIRQQMEAIAGSMVRLGEQGQAIGQIIATVEDLAAQSNLLAVNAAIEAAKSGEHGKGFSVVAQEVKSLAEQSRQATNQVRTILSDIQKATAAAVMATEQGSKAVESGGKQTEAAGESIQTLTGSITEAAQTATQIAASSQQQLVGMEQVAVAMENIKQTSTQNVSSARQLETAARNLNDLGQRLRQMVERYKV